MEQESRGEQKVTESEKPRQQAIIGSGSKVGMLTEAQYRDRIRRRLFRTLDYATIAFSMFCIYGSFVTADYLLIYLIEYLFQAEMRETSLLAIAFRGIKIGLALLAFVLATYHGIRSGIEQYRLDTKLVREDEKPHV